MGINIKKISSDNSVTQKGGMMWNKIYTGFSNGVLFIKSHLLFSVCFVAVWEATTLTGLVPSYILPPFTQVVHTFYLYLFSDVSAYGSPGNVPPLIYHGAISVWRVVVGAGFAMLTAVPLGIAIGLWRPIENNLDPIISILRPIPPLAWIPLAILWFGLGFKSVVFIIYLGGFFPMLVNTISGVKGTQRRLIEFAQVMGAKDKDIVTKVVIYDALPSVITGIRVGLGVSWMSLVAAEMIATKSGLGYMILMARWVFATDVVIVGMVAIGLTGFGMDYLLRRVERRFLRWRQASVKG